MKQIKLKLLAIGLISSFGLMAQQGPTMSGNANSTGTDDKKFWSRAGNTNAQGQNNIFGTMWNSPIYTYTAGINRTRLNGTFTAGGATIQPTINGVSFPAVNTSGYFGISANGYFANNTPISLLHLQGDNNTPYSPGGWRRWMKTGMFVSEHSDGMYVGMKPVLNTNNRSNAIINWSDDPWTGSGVDKLSFVFTQANPNGNGTGTNPINAASLDGYEFMQMATSTTLFNSQGTGEGTIGIGPVFTDAAPPQSRLHINAEENLRVWLQLTNQLGTGQNSADGLRIGINGDNNTNVNGTALIYNQENRHLLFSTNNNTNFVNIANGTTLERMRITSIAAPTSLANGGYGVYSPAGLNGNLTRVAISHDPQSPVTRPLSLLHLGYNTGANSVTPTATDGWRDWMDIGMFVSNGTDNTYLGLKQEQGIGSDRQDAVLNWGDNDASNPLFGPDNLRFIFTSTTTGAGNSPANSNNGLETARISPAAATTMGTNFGMVGIGDYSPTGPNAALPLQPNAKLDIDGDLRIRTVTQDNNLTQILAIDPLDKNRVHWIDGSNLGGNVAANNGVSVDMNNPNTVQLGVPCQDSLGNDNIPEILANAFTKDRVVAIGDHNLWFATYTGQKSGVGIGGQPASTNFCTTGNTLEVSANGSSKYGATSSSGLRFTHLTSDSLTVSVGTNGVVNTKVLTVDQDGDVVLVDAVGGGVTADNGLSIDPLNANNVQLGQEIIAGTLSFTGSAELLNDREIPLNGHDLIFSSTNNGFTTPGIERISIGLNPFTPGSPIFPTNPQNYVLPASAKLNLLNATEETGAHFITFMDPSNVGFAPPQYSGVKGSVYGLHNDKSIIGVLGQGISALPGVVVEGVRGEAFGSGVNIGVKGMSFSADKTSYGGFFRSHSVPGIPCLNGDNYGIFAEARGSSVSNIAVYATIDPSNPCNAADNWAGWFNGNVYISGTYGPSDANLKTNVISINNALDIINELNPVIFDFDNSVKPRLNLQNGKQYGLIAQEVETILPELVGTSLLPAEYDSLGNVIDASFNFKTLDYEKFVPILIAGMKEQNANLISKDSIINNLDTRLAYLEECIARANICTESNRTINTEPINNTNNKSVELVNSNSIILDQNMPNPFAENTVITYTIPAEVMEAKLLFYDLNGRIIKELMLEERGESKLTVYGNNLKTGVYTYSLIADGELIATKKMVKK